MIRFFDRLRGRTLPEMAENRGVAPSSIDTLRSRLDDSQTVEDVIAALRDSARAIVGSDGITVVRRDGDEVEYVTEDAVTPLWAGQRFSMRTCISGMAIQAQAPIVIANILEDKRVPLNAYLSTFVRSMIMVPIGHGDPQMAMGAYWRAAEPIASIAVDRMTAMASAAADALARVEGPPEAGAQVA